MNNRQKHLAKGRRIRSSMSADTRALKNRHIQLRDVLEEPQNTSLRFARVYDVLRHAPHISDAGAKKILLTARVWPLTRLGELEKIERDDILKCLPPRARD